MRIRSIAAALALTLVPLVAAAAQLTETGSTLLYPLMTTWSAAFGKAHPGFEMTTQATGSGAGIAAAADGSASLGGSDAYVSDEQRASGLVNVPLAVSGQHIAYNLPGLDERTHVRLTGQLLAEIYLGKLTKWNDGRIAAINAGVALPDATIVPIRRSDASGDTFLFTEYLKKTGGAEWTAGSGTRITWPDVAGAQAAKGNNELLQLVRAVRYSIGYIGISYLEQTRNAGLGVAALRNRAGAFVIPDSTGIQAAAIAAGHVPPDGRASLIDETGATTYPIANYEYAVVREHQADPQQAEKLRDFLSWVIDPAGGNAVSLLAPVHFAPLPASARAASKALIATLK